MQQILNDQEQLYVIFTGLALGVFLLLTGLSQLLSRRERVSEARSRRMKMLAKGHSTEEILALLKPADSGWAVRKLSLGRALARLLSQAGWTMGPQKFLALCLLASAVAFMVLLTWLAPPLAAPAALVLGAGLPLAVLSSARAKRLAAMTQQLPDALELMARGLRVGHPLNKAILSVAEDAADPIGTEFGLISDQVSYGDDLSDAFQEFAERIDTEDVHYLAASIGIQHGTGGDLARVLQILAQVIRNRILLRRKIQAISSEGRLTAWFLSALPVVMFAFTSAASPNYYGGVSHSSLFMPMAIAVVALTILNALTLRKLVNFRI